MVLFRMVVKLQSCVVMGLFGLSMVLFRMVVKHTLTGI